MTQHSVFKKRLERVSQRQGHTLATLHVGMDKQVANGMMLRAKIVGRQRACALRSKRHLGLLLAPISGMLAWVWAHWMRVTVSPFEMPIPNLVADLLLAFVAIGTLRAVFSMRGLVSFALQINGLVLGIWLLQAIVPLAPQLFSSLFTADWVQAQMQASASASELLGALAAL